MKKIYCFAICFVASVASLFASAEGKFTLTGYVDTYYTSDNLDKEYQDFTSINHEREKFSLNIAYLLFKYSDSSYRAKIGLQEGDIAKSSWFEEPQNIEQANIGIRLTKGLWLDGGIFTTHIGGEWTHPRMNYFSSHSSVTFFQPAYQAGVKLSYELNEHWSADFHIINGNHLFGDNNSQKTLAYSLSYESDFISAFYAGMTGNEEPKGRKPRNHTYHNVFLEMRLSENFGTKVQFDAASIKSNSKNKSLNWFYGYFVQSQYKFNEKYAASARYSYYSDVEGTYGIDAAGYDASLAIEYKPVANSYIRLESRYMKNTAGSSKNVFVANGKAGSEFVELSINYGLWFNLSF